MAKVKKLTGEEETALQAQHAARQAGWRNFHRELVGIFAGIGLGLVIVALIPAIRENYNLGTLILWGGALGGVVMSLERFERAGAALTKRENRPLNYVVGLGIPIVILVLIFAAN